MKNKTILILSLLAILTAPVYAQVAGDNVVIDADKQNYNAQNNTITFENNVKVQMGNVLIKSPRATVKSNEKGEPQDAVFMDGAYASRQDIDAKSEVKANVIKLSLFNKTLKAEGNARSVVVENGAPLVVIRSNNQEFDLSNNIINASGNVNMTYKEISTKSSRARITINQAGKPQMVNLMGNAIVMQGQSIIKAANFTFNPETNEMVAVGSTTSATVLNDKSQVLIKADYQQYDKSSNTLMTGGSVKVNYKNYVATGPKASFMSDGSSANPNKIVFLGRSRIKEDNRVVEANRIEITVDPKNFVAEGNVRTRFTQAQTQKKGKTQPVPVRQMKDQGSYLDKLDKQPAIVQTEEQKKLQEMVDKN